MLIPISELIAIVREAVKSKIPTESHTIEHQIDDIEWKIKSARIADIDVSDTLRWKALVENKNGIEL